MNNGSGKTDYARFEVVKLTDGFPVSKQRFQPVARQHSGYESAAYKK